MPKRLFPVPTTTNQSVEAGPAVTLKPSRWKRIFRRRRRSSSASSALSDTFSQLSGEMSKTPSMEDIRVMGHVQEIVLRDVSPESAISSDVSTVISRKESVETLAPGLARDLFSDGALYVDALEGKEGEMQRYDTMKSVYVDATDGETMEEVEVKETVEITVVAEVQDELPTIQEDDGESFFTSMSPEEFSAPSNVARKFLLLTFVILIVSSRSKKPMRIDSRW